MDDDDESVRIAVKALGDMRNSDPDFVYRVSHIPIVNSALRAYEHGKASSRVVKYGAEIVESSVISISRPVIDRLPITLDDFACRQLDRLGRYAYDDPSSDHHQPSHPPTPSRSPSPTPTPSSSHDPLPPHTPTPPPTTSSNQQVAQRSRWHAVLLEAGGLSAALSEENMRRLKYCLQWLQYATAHIDAQILVLRDFIAALQPLPHTHPHPHPLLPTNANSIPSSPHTPLSQAHLHTLAAIRRDVVHTIRQVVDVVSKYAGGALPEPARARVRGFILGLPRSWATRAGSAGDFAFGAGPSTAAAHKGGANKASAHCDDPGVAGGRKGRARPYSYQRDRDRDRDKAPTPVSPLSSPRAHTRNAPAPPTQAQTPAMALLAAQRILTLAAESLDMMRGVTGVVKDSLDRADAWVGRLGLGAGDAGGSGGGDGDGRVRTAEEGAVTTNARGHARTDTSASASASSASSVPSTPYSVPGTPAGDAGGDWGGGVYFGKGKEGEGAGAGVGAGVEVEVEGRVGRNGLDGKGQGREQRRERERERERVGVQERERVDGRGDVGKMDVDG